MARVQVTDNERRARLGQRHRLAESWRSDSVPQIADDLVAVHSTDPATVFLSLAARMPDATPAAIESALYEDRSVLRHHAMRRTIWVATPAMTQMTNAACTRKIARAERSRLLKWLAQTDGVDDPEGLLERSMARLIDAISQEGPISTRKLGKQHPDLAFKITTGSGAHTADVGAHTRLLQTAAFEARLMRTRPTGSWISAEYTWELIDRWTPIDFDEPDAAPAMAELVRAWLDRFGPGTERDLSWWAGTTKTAIRTALKSIEAVEVTLDDGEVGWVNATDSFVDGTTDVADSEPWVAVLPSLDSTVMGWKDRSWYLDDAFLPRLFDRNGNAGPTIWVDGRAVGGWTQRSDGDLGVELLDDLTRVQANALDDELERVRSFLGDIRFRERFPSPNQRDLLSASS